MGHAGFAQTHGEPDILCAAVSVLVLNTINALDELAGEDIAVATNEETGFIRCEIKGDLQEKSVFLLDTMVIGLKQLEADYGEEYLQVRIEEV